MDIAGLSMALANIQVTNSVSTAVLGKALEQNEAQGASLVSMIDASAMERSVNPHVGSNFDVTI